MKEIKEDFIKMVQNQKEEDDFVKWFAEEIKENRQKPEVKEDLAFIAQNNKKNTLDEISKRSVGGNRKKKIAGEVYTSLNPKDKIIITVGIATFITIVGLFHLSGNTIEGDGPIDKYKEAYHRELDDQGIVDFSSTYESIKYQDYVEENGTKNDFEVMKQIRDEKRELKETGDYGFFDPTLTINCITS